MRNTWLLGLAFGAAAASGFVLTTAAPASAAQDEANGARFTVVQGSVSVRGANGTQTATTDMPVATGDYISSGPNARAEVDMNGATVVRLAGSVEAHVIDAGQIQLADGTVEVAVLHGGYGTTQIDTPSVTIRASDKGTYRISIVAGGGTQVTARSGQVQVVTPQRTYTVEAGKSIVASGTAAHPTVADATAVAYDSFDQFGTDRDRTIAAELGQNTGIGYNDGGYNNGGYNNGYNYGYNGGGYGYPYGYGYGYGWPVAVAAPVCGFGFTFGWFGGFYGGCSIYPAIAFGGYYPWYSPYAYGWGWGYPYYGGYYGYGYGYGYGCCGYGYGGCCYNGGGNYHPPAYYGNGWRRDRVARGGSGGIAYRAPIRAVPDRPIPVGRAGNAPARAGGFTHGPVARGPIARNPIMRNPIMRNPIMRNPIMRNPITRNSIARDGAVQHREAQPVRIARANPPIRRETPIARTAPGRTDASNPWRRFDNDRGTNVAVRAPVARAPVNTRTAPVSERGGDRTVNDPRTTSSDPWSRFSAVRGNVSMRPDPESRSSYGNPYRGNDAGGGYGQRYGGGYNGGGYNGGGSRGYGGQQNVGGRSPSSGGYRGGQSAPSGPRGGTGGSGGMSGGGSRGGGRPPR